MNRLVAKLVQGSARLTFWRKPVEPTPAQPQSPAPGTASSVRPAEVESSAAVDVPVLRVGWFTRLKHALRRRKYPAQEPPPDPDQTVVKALPSRAPVDASAPADTVPSPAPSFLARLKNKLRRQPQPEQLEADGVAEKPSAVKPSAEKSGAEKNPGAAASSEVTPADDADAIPVSRMGRVLAMLSNQWVWIPGISIVMLAIVASMMLMLLRSKHENEQLLTKLVATQKELKQTSIKKQAPARQHSPRQAGDPDNVAVGSVADAEPGVDAGDCVVTDQASVIKNLKNCIDSFNNATAQ